MGSVPTAQTPKGADLLATSQIKLNQAGAANQGAQAGLNTTKDNTLGVVGDIGRFLRGELNEAGAAAKSTYEATKAKAQKWINQQTGGMPIEIYPKGN